MATAARRQEQSHRLRILQQQKRTDRFQILHRDRFECRYCGSRPGSDLLEVDHLVPKSRGGSEHEMNKVTACKTCNGRKSNAIIFPHDLVEAIDDDGWQIHKTYGQWKIVFSETEIGVEKDRYGYIEVSRLREGHMMSHLYDKGWAWDVYADMERAIGHLLLMVDL